MVIKRGPEFFLIWKICIKRSIRLLAFFFNKFSHLFKIRWTTDRIIIFNLRTILKQWILIKFYITELRQTIIIFYGFFSINFTLIDRLIENELLCSICICYLHNILNFIMHLKISLSILSHKFYTSRLFRSAIDVRTSIIVDILFSIWSPSNIINHNFALLTVLWIRFFFNLSSVSGVVNACLMEYISCLDISWLMSIWSVNFQ